MRKVLGVAVVAAAAWIGGCAPEGEETGAASYAAAACEAVTCHRTCRDGGYPDGMCRGSACICLTDDLSGDDVPPGGEDTPNGENCFNGVDDNGDGRVDCAEPACCNYAACAASAECHPCVPATERCEGGLDEDCDGLVDCMDPQCLPDPACQTDCDHTTETCELGGCNGYGGTNLDEWPEVEACLAQNDRGCAEEELYAWCTRVMDDGPGGLWYEIHEHWVADHCPGGTVVLDSSGGRDTYTCVDAVACIKYDCTTPLVLSFEPAAAVAYRPVSACRGFDLSAKGDGRGSSTDWPTSATPWLALDRDGDGAITSGAELFGSASPVPGGTAKNGFAALAPLDQDGDGAVDPDDPLFAALVIWADKNGDRVSQPEELRPLAVAGVLRLDVGYDLAPRCDARGNCAVERAPFVWLDADGGLREGALVDVHLPGR
jgi:hypothetical protein